MPRTNDPLAAVSTRTPPVTEQAHPAQVQNHSAGYVFDVGPHQRIRRFLTLGTAGGTYYVREGDHTRESTDVVLDWAKNDCLRLVEQALDVSVNGLAPKNDQALFAVAAAIGNGPLDGRRAAAAAVPQVARTGTHIYQFAGYAEQFRGWGRILRNAVADWYLRDVDQCAYQILKYRQRNGWTHRDLLRLSHPERGTPAQRALFDFAVGRTGRKEGEFSLDELPLVRAFIQAQQATTVAEWVSLIEANPSLSWEMLPDAATTKPAVWEAMIEAGLPQTALIRQLPKLTRIGLITPLGSVTAKIAAQLQDAERLRKARVHPVSVLIALRTYASGQGARSDATWTPVQQIADALDAGFYNSYGAVEPSGKRRMLAVDVSGSMGQAISGLPITCREAAAALALVAANVDKTPAIFGFSHRFAELNISPRMRLDEAVRRVYDSNFGNTDCSLPMVEALRNGWDVDSFEVYTDNETNTGRHPYQTLTEYRQRKNPDARFAVVGMTATPFSIANPDDPATLDIAGFDANCPKMLTDFAAGRL